MNFKPLYFAVMLLLPSADAGADSYRCDRKLVRTGDSVGHLLRTCGEPRFKDSGKEKIKQEGRQVEVRVKRWYYKKSRRSLERIVLIRSGNIVGIRTGDR